MTEVILPLLGLLASSDSLPLPGGRAGITSAAPPIAPAVIVALCVVAALATWLILPSKRELSVRRIGGVILLAAGLIFAGLLLRWTVALGGMSVYFWSFAAIAVFASFRVVTHTKPVYSALYFVLTVFATGGLFVLLWAEFMAAALVLIYAGAILITYVFVIMLASEAVTGATGGANEYVAAHDGVSRDPFLAAVVGFAVAGLLIFVIFDETHPLAKAAGLPVPSESQAILVEPAKPQAADVDAMASSQALGEELIDHQAVNVQLAGVILTLAMVGAITLARRKVILTDGDRLTAETMITPGTPVDDNPHSIPVYGTTNPRQKEYPEN